MSRLTIATSAQADASGGVTFDGFGAPGTGTAWVVTAAVPLAPGTASFQAWRTTEVWATWLGSAAGGPLLVTGSQRLVVKGTSLTKTTIYRCVLTGQSMPETTAQGVSVAPISSSTLTKTTLTGPVTANITGPVTIASGTVDLGAGTKVGITGDVTLAAGTKIVLATGSVVSLAAGTAVKVSTPVAVAGASASTSTFGVTKASASDVAALTSTSTTPTTLIPAPTSPARLQLFGFIATSPRRVLLETSTGTALVASTGGSSGTTSPTTTTNFTFDGAALPVGEGVAVVTGSTRGWSVTLTYRILT